MATSKPSRTSFSAPIALGRLLALGAVGAMIVAGYVLTGVGLPCPLLNATGLQCPFCGSTRAAVSLARLDIGQAWSYNALFVATIPVLMLCAAAWTVEALGGPALRTPSRQRPVTQSKIYLAVGFLALVFMIVRNLT